MLDQLPPQTMVTPQVDGVYVDSLKRQRRKETNPNPIKPLLGGK